MGNAITKIQEAVNNGSLSPVSSPQIRSSSQGPKNITAKGSFQPEKPQTKEGEERKISVSSESTLPEATNSIEKVSIKPVSVGIEDIDQDVFTAATTIKSAKSFFKYEPTYDKEYREAFKNPRPASLIVTYKPKNGEPFSDVLKLGILAIALSQADKAQIISTFGDNFLIQSFGRFPQTIRVSGFVISYGTLPNAFALEQWWRNFLSFSAYYEGILKGRRYGEDKSYFTSGVLHYNNVLYYCIFSSFSRVKAVPEDSIENIQMDGLVLKTTILPQVKIKVTDGKS